jgi:DNA-3-methyladenine glycosylase II
MDKKIINHFKKIDPILFSVLKKIDRIKSPSKSKNYFSDLCEAIINQQLSDKAAATIYKKFKKLFPSGIISAEKLLQIPDKKIRGVGTSWKKVEFMKNLAEKVARSEIKLEKLNELHDEEIITQLTELHGIGRWTAEMFLMFSLAREDIFSAGDLGLRRAIQKLYKMKNEPTQKQIEKISRKWSPYRTYAALALWRISDD